MGTRKKLKDKLVKELVTKTQYQFYSLQAEREPSHRFTRVWNSGMVSLIGDLTQKCSCAYSSWDSERNCSWIGRTKKKDPSPGLQYVATGQRQQMFCFNNSGEGYSHSAGITDMDNGSPFQSRHKYGDSGCTFPFIFFVCCKEKSKQTGLWTSVHFQFQYSPEIQHSSGNKFIYTHCNCTQKNHKISLNETSITVPRGFQFCLLPRSRFPNTFPRRVSVFHVFIFGDDIVQKRLCEKFYWRHVDNFLDVHTHQFLLSNHEYG